VSSGPSLYRRHRPRTFADLVGQEPITRTLRNAVQQGKVHHAYLFVGSRGTGKTSMAKILAACLNCVNGPTPDPCGACESCTAIAAATSLDVIEMDAASNNSVDDIRDLRESVAYAPVSGRHKVYILDEAHMLSTQAWNAFLKTLEEPPPNTIFVLATTEAQKVLPTVVDRCHRFDFARPTIDQIVTVLRRAAEAESIEISSQAIALIARSATGSFRDALGTLEQLVTYSGPSVALEDVVSVLGVAGSELLYEALDAVAEHDPRRALLAVARCAESGRDPASFIRDLEVHTRELLVVQTLGGEVPPELSITPDADELLTAQAGRLERADVVRQLDLLAQALEALKAGADARTQLELALVKAATPEVDASTRALLARLERLEAAIAGDSAPVTASRTTPERPRARRAGVAVAEAVAVVEEGERKPVANAGGDVEGVSDLWPAIVEAVRAEKPLLAALIAEARPIELAKGQLTLAFAPGADFMRRKAEEQTNRNVVAEAVRAITGQALRLTYELREGLEPLTSPALSEEEWVTRVLTELDAEELAEELTPPTEAS
jgi:DNA polymerase-3 subunit gamma/tau